MVNVQELKRKVCLVGDWGVGKTSLIRKFVFDQFNDRYLVTLGTKITKKRIKYKLTNNDIIDLNLIIWDVMGQKEFKKVQLTAYENTNGVFIVCDITRKDTLNSIKNWRRELFDVTGNIPMIILANKNDLRDQAKFTSEEVAEVANGLNALYYLTSAKTGENIEKAFMKMGIRMIE